MKTKNDYKSKIPKEHLRLHYIQNGNCDYLDWRLYIWGPGYKDERLKWGSGLEASGIDEYGIYWDIPREKEQAINFIIHNDYTRVSSITANEYKSDTQDELWAIEETKKIYSNLSLALDEANIDPIPSPSENYVRLHYYCPDSNYEELYLSFWQEDEETGQKNISGKITTNNHDTCGIYWDIPYQPQNGKLKFIVYRGEKEESNGVQEYPNLKSRPEIWMKSGDSNKYNNGLNLFEENEIEEAMVFADNKIVVRFKFPVEDRIWVMYGSKVVPIKEIENSNEPEYYLTLEQSLEYNHPYTVKAGRLTAKTILSPEIIDRNYTYQGSLGVNYSSQESIFKLWAPSAQRVELELFEEPKGEATAVYPLTKSESGVWIRKVEGDLKGKYYHYIVNNSGNKQKALDPYAKSMSGFDFSEDHLAKGAIIDLEDTDPNNWKDDGYVNLESDCNVVIYEMSVRDFTISSNSEVEADKRGTYLGFIDKISHLKELGITHVQLMPVLNFYFGNEYKQDFEDIREIEDEAKMNYNWGYDPHNYFTPEGWYSSNPGNPEARVRELKELIKALHEADIGVILDVVYNHTAITDIFETIVPAYYYRRHADNSLTNGSGCGNDTASEREMMRKLIIDSTTYWTDEYHVDGFRFDLMGLHDEKTIKRMAKEVRKINPDAVLLGEGWNLGTLSAEEKYVKAAGEKRSLLRVDSGPAVFNDGIRDALKQNHFGGNLEDGGFLQGFVNSKSLIRSGIIAGMVNYESNLAIESDPYHRFADQPEEVINYVSCHDGYTLWDKIVGSTPNASLEERIRMAKLGASIILTSQGRAFIHGGEEMLRTKPNPNKYKNLDHNSYSSGDYTNQIDWNRKEEYSEVVEYYKGLIQLRKEHPAFRMETMEEIQYGLSFFAEGIDFVIAFKLDCPTDDWEKIIVAHNANRTEKVIKEHEVTEDWEVVADGNNAGVKALATTEEIINAGEIILPPISTVIIHN